MAAAERNNLEACDILLQNGANINARDVSLEGITALMLCCEKCPSTTVGFLLRHGADPRIRDNFGRDVFDHARERTDDDEAEIQRMLHKACKRYERRQLDDAV